MTTLTRRWSDAQTRKCTPPTGWTSAPTLRRRVAALGGMRASRPFAGTRRLAAATRSVPGSGCAARFGEAAAKPLHQVDDVRVVRPFLLDEIRGLSLHLGLDDPHEVLAVVVGVFVGIPLVSQVLDEGFSHVELFLPNGSP